ncbi:MAG: NUDIX domain-containing protein [Bacteroidota bacterium]
MDEKIQIIDNEQLSDDWYKLDRYTFVYRTRQGKVQRHVREIFDRGNGAAILLYNLSQKTIILTRQFRLPTFLNGNTSGMMIETAAGMLDDDSPEDCIRREAEEETGYRVNNVRRVFDAYMSPGALTELLYFFVAEYDSSLKVGEGGGLEAEQEDIEVLEMDIKEAYQMIGRGEICDAKTIMLLQYAMLNLFASKKE